MSDDQLAAPVGVTPGSGALAPEPVDEQLAQPDPLLCTICSHALAAHAGGRCLIALGAYGTEGPCPCPDVPAAVAPVDLPQLP